MPKYELMAHQKEGVAFLNSVGGVGALLYDPGVGKQQPVSEPVLTPNGWTTMGELVAGDFVVAKDGTATEVLSVHPQTERSVYRVTMNDGSWAFAGPDHLWLARTHNHARRGTDFSVVTTRMLGETIGRRWEIPMTEAVEFPETNSIDPYLAGVIAGDGACRARSVELCTDREIIAALGLAVSRDHETCDYVAYAYVPVPLHRHEFRGQRSHEKSLPDDILHGSIDQRLAALQGVLDTDGTPIATGGVEFATASAVLTDQVAWLVESLGGSARRGKDRRGEYTYKGQTLEGQVSYRLNIKLPEGLAPFRLARKLSRWVPPTKYPVKRCVASVEYSHEEESVCIRVAHDSRTYLTRSCIVTHNTGTTLSWVDGIARAKPGREVRVLVVAPLTAADTWVLQAPPFMDSMVKARMMQGSTASILTKMVKARNWVDVPDAKIKVDHPGSVASQVSGSKVTILSMSAGAVSSYCADHERRTDMMQAVRKYAPHLIVVDESHIIKSPNANISTAMYQMGQIAPFRIILTGTVEPHSPLDVFGQWRFLAPWTFSNEYGEDYTKRPAKMTKDQRKAIKPWSWTRFKARYSTPGGYQGKGIGEFVNLDDLYDRVAERAHVVKKEDALDLPPVTDIPVHVTLSPKERKAYDQMRDELALELASGELIEAPNALAKIMKLRQVTAGFVKDTETKEIHVVGTSKQKAVSEVVNIQLAGEKRLVVFAYFRAECDALAAMLRRTNKGATVEVVTGATKPKDRLAIRQRFADVSGNPERTILVAQARTMSLSVNELVTAQHAVFVSLSERRDDWVQARGRLDRNGQKGQHVTFWNVIVPDTVDEIMLDKHRDRGDLEKALLDHIRNTPHHGKRRG